MDRTIRERAGAAAWVWGGLLLCMLALALAAPEEAAAEQLTIPGVPLVTNAGFECSGGTYAVAALQGGQMQIHNGWTVAILDGTPWLNSASLEFNRGCGGHVEKIEGGDSLAIFAHDIEWTSQPGKPFDAAVYQQVQVTPGRAYSLSAWMVSLCGGSTTPNDCPRDYYMAKMLGIDPTGGVDPSADTVIWVEDRRNFIEDGKRVGWTNLRLAAVAEAETITLFGRIRSPFQWHGNHAFIDAFSLMEAPTAALSASEDDGCTAQIAWEGSQSPAIGQIPGGTYRLEFDLEYRAGNAGPWQSWLVDQPAGEATFTCPQPGAAHFLRVRARAEQPSGGGGAWPNHRYPGLWSDPLPLAASQTLIRHELFVPRVER